MVTIRLARHGAKKVPFYRIVVTNHRSSRDGRFIERLGIFDPREGKDLFQIDRDRLGYWQTKGAKPSATLTKLLKKYPAAAAAAQ
ncbi:MAG TPA: 30S ribosomal protein S16 [Polyangiaceae bacterium]|nr:30S ribosomal protein S16 [Polyangiaceae bacterium]